MPSKTDEPRNRCEECARCHLLKKCITEATSVKNPQFWIHEQWNLFYQIVFGKYMLVNSEKDELFFATRKIISALYVLDINNTAPIIHIDMDMREAEYEECKTCPDHNIRIVAGYLYGIGYNYLRERFNFAANSLNFFKCIDPGYGVDIIEFIRFSKKFFKNIDQILTSPFQQTTTFDKEV